MPRLTVCIPTIHGREGNISELLQTLLKQAENKDVEVLWLGDNRKMSLGRKRRLLYMLAYKTEYISFVDDDDMVSDDYIDTLLKATESGKDLINFLMEFNDGKTRYDVRFSKDYANINLKDKVYRQSHTLMCWKYSVLHAKCFPDITQFEDSTFAQIASGRAVTEMQIEKVLYFYRYNPLTSTQTEQNVKQ